MIRDFLLFFNENIVIEYSEDLYNDFIMQLGGKRFGHGLSVHHKISCGILQSGSAWIYRF